VNLPVSPKWTQHEIIPSEKVAVLGPGVMGAQSAAHLVNVKVPVVLFNLPAKEGAKNGIVTRAIENLKKLKPSPLGLGTRWVRPGLSVLQQWCTPCGGTISGTAWSRCAWAWAWAWGRARRASSSASDALVGRAPRL
jgi:hypothetical protein